LSGVHDGTEDSAHLPPLTGGPGVNKTFNN